MPLNVAIRRPAPTRWRALVLAWAAALALIGCGTDVPSAAPTPPGASPGPTSGSTVVPAPTQTPRPAAEVYAEIRSTVEATRGLQPTKAVEPVSLDETQLKTNLTADFDKENTADELKLAEDELIT